jgi:hypothetical protein
MSRLLLLAALLLPLAGVSGATKAERCAKYKAELAEIAEARKRGGSDAHLHKLEAKRQKVLAAQAKHHCGG